MRSPKDHELLLIEFLINRAKLSIKTDGLKVLDMKDGGMGSIHLIDNGKNRRTGRMASDCQFLDEDKTPVIVSLLLDEGGQLFELDIWKVDFNRTIKFPSDIKELTLIS